MPAGQTAADFRKQTYHGKPVLTWWQGTGLGGVAQGVDYVYDNHYRKIAEVRAATATPPTATSSSSRSRTPLIVAYGVATADLTSIGGSDHQKVIDGVVQEVDIRTGKVLFEWNSADHVPYSESRQPLPASPDSPWDWFHINAVKPDAGGNLLVDSRNTWAAYEISAWQHDPEPLGGGRYSFFDNESAGIANTGTGAVDELAYSRAVTVQLDHRRHTATLVASDDQPSGLIASSQGNAQPLPNGGRLVGWGSQPYVSEFGRSGDLRFNAQWPNGVISYRAYRFDWK